MEPGVISPAGRILRLYEILSRETDENHKLTGRELVSRLQAEGFHSSPETLRTDIRTLLGIRVENRSSSK